VQRFLREARSAAKLRHPNIVQAYDVGQADGYYFFAMEFVDGEALSEIIRRDGPLEPSRALDVMKQVTSALAAAHKEGIVHRDIKPSNIMLDKEGQVRVTDFGLAKRAEGDVEVTADGAVLGTPAYVAPEMAKGGEADGRSDLYSLGATIFCALAGRPPFEGRNFSEVLVKQATEQAPPLATLAPRVDRRLCHIIDRLLRKNPEARYQSAAALLDDLNGLGKLQSVAAPRAEGRAKPAEAPTLEMTEGQRARVGGACVPRVSPRAGDGPPTRSPKATWLAVAAVAVIAIVVGIVVLGRGPKSPDQAKSAKSSTSSPVHPSTPPPIPPPQNPPPPPPPPP
ncbi:MAG TPA: serine/threonine-protein kinase, partial [Planctomycetota bacterium]|nr:serine/threonine-protein kinase [Planctomycetota bacterium]